MSKKILILGKIPPPIGGVTVHTSRLLNSLEKDGILFKFFKLDFVNLLLFPFYVINYSCVHVHSSNPLVRLYVMIICKIYGKYGIVTIHGNLNRFKLRIKNWIDKKTIQIANKPITLNFSSLELAKKINLHAEIVSSFIPPDESKEYLPQSNTQFINSMRAKYDIIFCTNASNLSYDKKGNEIYGITELIDFFGNHTQFGLVFSDPSGAYKNEFEKHNLSISDNIYIINGSHSFYKVMKLSDASIRNTSTDGDSISVKESLFLNKRTFTTDVVSRPIGCFIYKKGNLEEILAHLHQDIEVHNNKVENGYIRLKEIYRNCSDEKSNSHL